MDITWLIYKFSVAVRWPNSALLGHLTATENLYINQVMSIVSFEYNLLAMWLQYAKTTPWPPKMAYSALVRLSQRVKMSVRLFVTTQFNPTPTSQLEPDTHYTTSFYVLWTFYAM